MRLAGVDFHFTRFQPSISGPSIVMTDAIDRSIKTLVIMSAWGSRNMENTLIPRVMASSGNTANEMKMPSLRAKSNATAPAPVGRERINSHP